MNVQLSSTEPRGSAVRGVHAGSFSSLRNSRWLLVADELVRADALAEELRKAGATARLVDPMGVELSYHQDFDAQILLSRSGLDLRFLHDRLLAYPGLRWANPLTSGFVRTANPNDAKASLTRLTREALSALRPDRELLIAAKSAAPRFEVPFRRMGAARILRALCDANDVFCVHLETDRQRAVIEIAGDLVLSVFMESAGGPALLGTTALADVLELHDAKAVVKRRPRQLSPRLCEPVDRAITLALAETWERRRANEDAESPTLRIRSPLALNAFGDKTDDALEPPTDDSSDLPEPGASASPAEADEEIGTPRTPRISGIVMRPPPPVPQSSEPPRAPASWRSRVTMPALRPHQIALALSVVIALATALWVIHARQATQPKPTPGQAAGQPPSATPRRATPLAKTAQLAKTAPPAKATPPAKAASIATDVRSEAPRSAPSPSANEARVLRADDAADDEEASAREVDDESAQEDANAVGRANDALESGKDAHDFARLAKEALREGQAEEAIALIESALQLRPRRVAYLVVYGDALAEAGRSDESRVQYELALEKRPDAWWIKQRLEANATRRSE